MSDSPGTERLSAIDPVVFLLELVLLAAFAVAGARLVDPLWSRIVLAIALPLACAVLWGMWLAPRASRRLRHPARMWVNIALAIVAAALLGIAGLPWWGLAFLIVTGGVFAAA